MQLIIPLSTLALVSVLVDLTDLVTTGTIKLFVLIRVSAFQRLEYTIGI